MRRRGCGFPALLAWAWLVGAVAAAGPDLIDPVGLPNQRLAPTAHVDLALPPLPQREGLTPVLRFRAVASSHGPAGCGFILAVSLNGKGLSRFTESDAERLVGRSPSFALRDRASEFQVFNGSCLMLLYAPSLDTADQMTEDGLGSRFCLVLTDAARGVDGNTLTLRNVLPEPPAPGAGYAAVAEIEVGWIRDDALPQPPNEVPARGSLAEAPQGDGIGLRVASGGGFSVRSGAGPELMVETAVGLSADGPSDLLAQERDPGQGVGGAVSVTPADDRGYRLVAAWASLRLERTLRVEGDLVRWHERWENLGDSAAGVPFRHRLFLRGETAEAWLSGSRENSALAGMSQNPTVFLGSTTSPGAGVGVTAESDWLRLLQSCRARGGVVQLHSNSLALGPGQAIELEWTVAPVADGGYWTFLNGLRTRRGLNGRTLDRPIFFGFDEAPGGVSEEDTLRRSLGHLGPVAVILGPWMRLEMDRDTVRAGEYPKTAPGAPPTAGPCPDLDVDAYLTFAHRDAAWQRFARRVGAIRAACPEVLLLQDMHPAMEIVYKPALDRWPTAGDAIRDARGRPFEDPTYTRAWLRDLATEGWGVLYFVPRDGSPHLAELLASMARSLEKAQVDGVYCDEFSWGYAQRGYSRYDYSRSDGYSADLDASGRPVRLKSDNAADTASAQRQLVEAVTGRGKLFLANGAASLAEIDRLPYMRMVEGGNGSAWFGNSHLNPVPLVLGNMGDRSTLAGILASVRECVAQGCVYLPVRTNLLLPGPESFVCKQYPLTVREIRPGAVIGEERVIAVRSGGYPPPGRPGDVVVLTYDASGELATRVRLGGAVDALPLDVPKGGLVIAEAVGP